MGGELLIGLFIVGIALGLVAVAAAARRVTSVGWRRIAVLFAVFATVASLPPVALIAVGSFVKFTSPSPLESQLR